MPMRILYCNKYNFPFSGTEVYLFDLMQMMETHGHQVALFSMADERGAPTPYDGYFVPHVDFKNSKHSFLERVRLAVHAVYSREARYRLGQMIDEFRPDVAHVRNIYHHLSPSIFWELKQRGIPVLYHLNDFKLLCPNYNLVARGRVCERCQGGRFWNVVAKDCYAGADAPFSYAKRTHPLFWPAFPREGSFRLVTGSAVCTHASAEDCGGWAESRGP
jgi:hypothetical protein